MNTIWYKMHEHKILHYSNMSNSNKIFNVDEVTGKERSALETTAAEAQIEAPTAKLARQIETNAEQEKAAAQQAANFAKTIGEEYTGESMAATDKLQRDASNATNAAVLEGKKDVDHVKAVGTEYVEQVKALAKSAIETVQTYLPLSVPNLSEGTKTNTESQSSSGDIPAPLESGPHIVNPTKGGGKD